MSFILLKISRAFLILQLISIKKQQLGEKNNHDDG